MAKSIEEQSEAVLKKHLAIGLPKSQVKFVGKTAYKQFTSMRSYKESSATLARVAKSLGVSRLKQIDFEQAQDYLNRRKEEERAGNNVLHVESKERSSQRLVSQKTIDAERKALSMLLGQPLARVFTSASSPMKSRAYTSYQVDAITKAQSSRNALSTQIAHAAGLRAHELLQIRRADELQITSSRKWSDNRFNGLSGENYVVVGKGGLIREIRIPSDLAAQLESKRFAEPVEVMDRGVRYRSYYDIAGGNAFSKSFSSASTRALGMSHGAHGLRHQYAQARMAHFRSQGFSEKRAKTLVSQELGHFRASITNVYLK